MAAAFGVPGLVRVAGGAHLFPHQLPQPDRGDVRLGDVLLDIRPLRAHLHQAMKTLCAALVLWLAGTACALAQERLEAGTIELLEGDALIEAKGAGNRAAKLGEPVYQGDTITTFGGTELHLRMADGGYLSLRE